MSQIKLNSVEDKLQFKSSSSNLFSCKVNTLSKSYPNGWVYSGFFTIQLHSSPRCARGLEIEGTQSSGLYQEYPVRLTAYMGE